MIDEVMMLRHGRTQYNLEHRLQGQIDVPLDIVGQWQVDQTGFALASRYYWAKVNRLAEHPEAIAQPGPDAAERTDTRQFEEAPAAGRRMVVMTSDLFRAQQTAHAFADILGLPVTCDQRLRERSFGEWEGMTRAEIDAKLPQIIEFSECGDFIDTPVKRYSSGMFVKLAFAVAAHLDSEIMVMDEVLAVGDMKFQQKCLGKMSDVANQDGRTVLYVSHNMSTIRQLCTRCVVLDKGRVIFDGDVEQAIAVYMDTTDVNVVHYDLADVARMTGSAGKRFRLETLDFVGKESSVFADTEKMRVKITWRVSEPFAGIHMKMNLHARDSTPVGITHPVDLGPAEPGKIYTSVFEFDPSLLGEGQYFFYLDIFDGALAHAVCLDKPVTEFAFEVTNSDLTMPEWASGWGRIHFPPVKLVQE